MSIQKSRSAATWPARSASVATIGSWVGEGGELGGLLVGQGRAEWGDSDVAARAGEGDGDRVHRAFDDDRSSPVQLA